MGESGSERTDTERELMQATGEALAEHGVAAVTTQKIADEWGRAQSLVHYYHDTKEDLIVAYIEFLTERQRAAYEERAEDPPLDRLAWMVAEDLHADQGAAQTVNVLNDLHGEAPHNERYRAALADLEADGQAFLTDAIRDGVDDGTFRSVDPESTALFLLSASDGIYLRTVSLDQREAADLFRAGTEQFVRDTLLTENAREDWSGFGDDSSAGGGSGNSSAEGDG